jgi:hypothetical protein
VAVVSTVLYCEGSPYLSITFNSLIVSFWAKISRLGKWLTTGHTAGIPKRIKKFWEEPIDYFLSIRHGPNTKCQHFLIAVGTSLPSCCYLGKTGGYIDPQFFYWCLYSSPRERVYRAAVQQRKGGYTLPSRCPGTTGGIHIQTYEVMGGIYEVRRWDGLRCHVTCMSDYRRGLDCWSDLLESLIHCHTQTSVLYLLVFTSRCLVAASTADDPLPLGSRTIPGLSYQLLRATAHNDWAPAVL